MKRILCVMFLFAVLFSPAVDAQACVGRTIHIGTVDSQVGRVITNLFVVFIGERTGTTAIPAFYKNSAELYGAASKGEVDIIIEDAEVALKVLKAKGIEASAASLGAEEKYRLLKEKYEKELNLIWLDASGPMKNGGADSFMAPVITKEALQFFPALPRVVNRLSKVLDQSVVEKLSADVGSGEKPKRAARDFLRERKLI